MVNTKEEPEPSHMCNLCIILHMDMISRSQMETMSLMGENLLETMLTVLMSILSMEGNHFELGGDSKPSC